MLFTTTARFFALQRAYTDLDDLFTGRLTGTAISDVYSKYRAFVLENAPEVQETLAARSVNKNEIRRSACLRALLISVCDLMGWPRVHLVDIGCSIGINLLLDDLPAGHPPHERQSGEAEILTAHTRVKAGRPPQSPMPQIQSRIGLDTERLDPNDPDDRNWVLSHILPEDSGQMEAMNKALDILAKNPPGVLVGDASELINEAVDQLSRDVPVVFLHSLMLHQLRARQRARLLTSIKEISSERPCARISMELSGELCQLRLFSPDTQEDGALMGVADMDARWMTWNTA